MKKMKKMKKINGGTGVFIENQNLEQNFIDFLQNSDIEYLNHGTFGVVFRATLDSTSGYVSKYKNIDSSEYDTPVDSLIIKISSLGYKPTITQEALSVLISPISENDFKREVNIQTDIFLKTMNYLQPLCPAIVYSNTYSNSETQIINIIKDKLPQNSRNKDYLSFFIENMTGYTIIGMELLKDYKTIHEWLDISRDHNTYICYMNMAVFILIELAIKTGYSHADFHNSNIMINPNDTLYFSYPPQSHVGNSRQIQPMNGSVILIDFGLAVKIPIETSNQIKTLYDAKDYAPIIKLLCKIPR